MSTQCFVVEILPGFPGFWKSCRKQDPFCIIYKCIYIPVLCDELFYKFIHRRERSKFTSSRYPLLCLGNDFENISETFWRYGGWNAVLSSVERAVQARARCRDDPTSKNEFLKMVFPFIWA